MGWRDWGARALDFFVERRAEDVERRADAALLAALSGSGGAWAGIPSSAAGSATLLVVHECAQAWARRLSCARVSGAPSCVDPILLWNVGRDLALAGESLHVIRRDARGDVSLLPVVGHDVTGGGDDPRAWRYRVDLSEPDVTRELIVTGAGVVHFRLPGAELFRGRHALEGARETLVLLSAVEQALSDDARIRPKNLIPIPPMIPEDKRAKLRAIMADRGDSVVFPMTTQFGSDRPQTDWKPHRSGPDPAAALVELRAALRAQVRECYGCPLPASGSGVRDTDRILSVTVDGLARILESELRAKLAGAAGVRLSFPLGAADATARGRAVHVMVQSGIPLSDARRLSGLE